MMILLWFSKLMSKKKKKLDTVWFAGLAPSSFIAPVSVLSIGFGQLTMRKATSRQNNFKNPSYYIKDESEQLLRVYFVCRGKLMCPKSPRLSLDLSSFCKFERNRISKSCMLRTIWSGQRIPLFYFLVHACITYVMIISSKRKYK